MDTLGLKPRQPVVHDVENWDDDDDLVIDGDDLSFRSSVTTATQGHARRRDSSSSHVSLRSDLESWPGEEKQVQLPAHDETSTLDAIAAAQHAGIPLPKNVPPSALMGGTIKRLGGRKIRKIIQDDWEHDLELPDPSLRLKIKTIPDNDYSDKFGQVSGESDHMSLQGATQPLVGIMAQSERRSSVQSITSALSAALNLEKYKENDDDDLVGQVVDTIKACSIKGQTPSNPIPYITPPTPQKVDGPKDADDDFEKDLELPSDGKLRLTTKRDIPKTPSSHAEDLDWGEGSLGTRYGGTRREGRSNRSSSASALSPSVSSSITAESEDEHFEGILLPTGPVNFRERLRTRKKSISPERILEEPEPSPKKMVPAAPEGRDFFEGLDIGDGNVFDAGKLTLHRNIKIKETCPPSPARPPTAVSLTFTNKPPPQPRHRLSHDRTHSSSLEPVYEGSGPVTQPRGRPSRSRLGHSSQTSVTSLPGARTASPATGRSVPPAAAPQRKEVATRSSFTSLRIETTTSAQLLKQKRSMPVVRSFNSPAKPMTGRPDHGSSRPDGSRAPFGLRPKTPVERQRAGMGEAMPGQSKRNPLPPFLPAGASKSQSHHVISKTLRQFRRHDSDNAIDIRPFACPPSRSATRSPPSPQRYKIAAGTWERLSKPKNKKNFGDGHELDGFDDLPTSRETETRFLKHPAGGPKTARPKPNQSGPSDKTSPPPSSPSSPAKAVPIPRFARHTAASRRARDTLLAQRAPSAGSLPLGASHRDSQFGTSRNPMSSQPRSPGQSGRASPPLKGRFSPQSKGSVSPLSKARSSPQLKDRVLPQSRERPSPEPKTRSPQSKNFSSHQPASRSSPQNQDQPAQQKVRSKRRPKRPPQLKPHLIANLNTGKESKTVNGMFYNADTYCWEGNENALNAFDGSSSTPSTISAAQHFGKDRDAMTPRPALITNISATKGVQVVGGMFFDPQNMCWIKIGPQKNVGSDAGDTMDGFNALEDEADVFKDIPDLEDKSADDRADGRISDMKDDWLVGEEFDVGPEFIRRHREEEERWRRKCGMWVGRGLRNREAWRWTIRDLVSQFDDAPM
ncbi:hypothetical protein CDD81_3309 [Ophiocordyceps australis]|uniref:Cytokinesis regulator n=1 Tax=Ophiocordyceps australis TaxID=1399860 RepID=A0A2C5XJU2_9HYPO|nr:hypothetical protein CDD81_3309 [Ophiocordyceps australis]